MKQLSDSFTLTNGYNMPCIGFGTWHAPNGDTAISAVKAALESGYWHIDAAAIYGNEISELLLKFRLPRVT